MQEQILDDAWSPMDAKVALKLNMRINLNTMMWGPPGCGKSDIARQVAAEEGMNLIDLRAAQMDPVDVRGLPWIDKENNVTMNAWPEFLPRDPNWNGVVFLDELPDAPKMVQSALYQFVLDRKLGTWVAPPGMRIIAAGNRMGDGAASRGMSTALRMRFAHMTIVPSVDDWVKWALGNNINVYVIAFLRSNQKLLTNFDPMSKDNTFASPRTWEFVSKLMDVSPDPKHRLQQLVGIIGPAAAIEFNAFINVADRIQDPDYIIDNPTTASVPDTDPSAMFVTIGNLSRVATAANFGDIMKYGKRFASRDYTSLLVVDSSRRNPEVVNTKAYIDWKVNYEEAA